MYKVIVVDDEPRVRRGLTSLIPKLDAEWSVVGEARNGYEALEAVKKELPDLVITDIRMPQMNGLDLLSHLKEYPVHVVILSGYGYFEYAQTAVKYGAFDYLLKPLKPEDIESVLGRVKKERQLKPIDSRSSSGMPNYSKLWKDWLLGLQEEKELPAQLSAMFATGAAQFRIFVIEVDEIDELINEDQWGDRQLVLFAVRNIVQDVTDKMKADAHFLFANGAQLYLLTMNETESRQLAKRCIEEVKMWLRISTSIGISEASDHYAALPYLVQHAGVALQNKCFYGCGTVGEYDELKLEDIIEVGYPIELETELMKEIRGGQLERAACILQTFIETAKQRNVSFRLFRRFCLQLVSSVIRLAYELKIYELVLTHLTRPIDLFDRSFTLEEYVDFMHSLMEACIVSMEWKRTQKHNQTIERAVDFIQGNYAKDISLEDTARHVHMNASYFCSYFKMETGCSFVEYVTSVRMEKAKTLMMDAQLRLYEIAQLVGYQEVKYFSRLFKKRMGVTPAEYRQFFFRKED
ncbi:response regulator [Paenibacillus oryzisoli]|uniref:response regulator transcription factor n=1 Tax=Paenibacillus oryzisoli TaxID=1850517 RepID=UPI003D29D213